MRCLELIISDILLYSEEPSSTDMDFGKRLEKIQELHAEIGRLIFAGMINPHLRPSILDSIDKIYRIVE
jgi:hypothetical protein